MAISEAESEAAASVAAALIGDFTGAPVAVAVEAPPVAVSSPAVDDNAPDLDEPEVAEAPSFEYTPEVPEDVLRELDEAEIDDEVERELAARVPDEDEYGVSEDEDTVRERIKMEKRLAYLEGQLTKTKAGAWKEEALKYFPLSRHALDDINVSSRRAFLKAAKVEHEKILPHVQSALAEAKGFVDAEKLAGRTEGKQEARAAYGEPLTGPDVNEIDQAAADSNLTVAREEAKKTGSLVNVFKRLMEQGK